MRLNDHQVIQQLDTLDVVVLDEETAQEVTIAFKDLGNALGALSYFHFGFSAGTATEPVGDPDLSAEHAVPTAQHGEGEDG